jgi:hypothetical protein
MIEYAGSKTLLFFCHLLLLDRYGLRLRILVNCQLPGSTCLSVDAKYILAEDLPQLPLQVLAIHSVLYALNIFKFCDNNRQFSMIYSAKKLACYT